MREQVRSLIGESLRTKTGRPFEVVDVTDSTVRYTVNGKPYMGRLATIEDAAKLVRDGGSLHAPGDIARVAPTSRSRAYEWAVLKRLGIVT